MIFPFMFCFLCISLLSMMLLYKDNYPYVVIEIYFHFMFVVFGDKDRDYIIIDMISLYVLSLGLCLFFGIYDNIKDISYDDFYFVCVVGDHWLYVIYILSLTYDNLFFYFLCVVCFGGWVYNPCDMGIIELFIS